MMKLLLPTFLLLLALALVACDNNNNQTPDSIYTKEVIAYIEDDGNQIPAELMKEIYEIQLADDIRVMLIQSPKIEDALVVVNSNEIPPEDSTHFDEVSNATVAVVLTLKDDIMFSNQEVQSIAEIIKGSISGLSDENITISDTNLNYYQLSDKNENVD